MRALCLLIVGLPTLVHAGGFELPGSGAEALGRGTAFTAKADNLTALEYNLAGLARQRGTRLLIDANLAFNASEFQRAGNYPDDPSMPDTPWGGTPFPKVSNSGRPVPVPFVGISTDAGKLDRWTFAVGLFAPSVTGARKFGVSIGDQPPTVRNTPAPSRYDVYQATAIILYPTLAAAVRVTRWFDLGIALHLVVAQVDVAATINTADLLGPALCQGSNPEYYGCDSLTRVKASAFTATAGIGAMFHPRRDLSIGLNLRPRIDLQAAGTIHVSSPPKSTMSPFPESAASVTLHLPWVLRLGIRYAFLKRDFEAGDIEVDATYEAWHDAEGGSDIVNIPQLGFLSDLKATIARNYQDTYSVRLGGAGNIRLARGVLVLRAGGYYESSATQNKDTRLDFDTLQKVAATLGLGYQVRGFHVDIAYAYVWSPDRTVTDGSNHVVGLNGNSAAIANNGRFHSSTMILSVGLQFVWDELLRRKRVIHYD